MDIKDLRNESPYICLSDEDFELFCEQFEIGDELEIDDNDCECETFIVGSTRRCSCGNRRCDVSCDSYEGRKFFFIEVF